MGDPIRRPVVALALALAGAAYAHGARPSDPAVPGQACDVHRQELVGRVREESTGRGVWAFITVWPRGGAPSPNVPLRRYDAATDSSGYYRVAVQGRGGRLTVTARSVGNYEERRDIDKRFLCGGLRPCPPPRPDLPPCARDTLNFYVRPVPIELEA